MPLLPVDRDKTGKTNIAEVENRNASPEVSDLDRRIARFFCFVILA
jgi:hypothetical protein